MKLLAILFSLLIACSSSAQNIEYWVPIQLKNADAGATGYLNSFDHTIIIEQENNGEIQRLLYDTTFNLIKEYTNRTHELSLDESKKVPSFYREISVKGNNLEVYVTKEKLQIWSLDFINEQDKKLFEFSLKETYEDEALIAAIPQVSGVLFLTHAKKAAKLFMYDYNVRSNTVLTKEFSLPEHSLTPDESKKWGSHLSVKYSKELSALYVSDLAHPKSLEISKTNQLFYDDHKLFIVLKIPYKAGFHILELDKATGDCSFANYLINKTNLGEIGTSSQRIPSVTAIDSLLIIQNSNVDFIEYYFFNIYTKQLVKKFRAQSDKDFSTLVHSKMIQLGTYISKDEKKEIDNEKAFLRKKNSGIPFVKALRSDDDSLIISFGSYVATEGIEGTLLSMATMGISELSPYRLWAFHLVPYLQTSRNKFVFAHSKFSCNTLQPSSLQNLVTSINLLADDDKIDDLEHKSSFVVELDGRIIVGVYDKAKGKYHMSIY